MKTKKLIMILLMLLALILSTLTAFADLVEIPPHSEEESEISASQDISEDSGRTSTSSEESTTQQDGNNVGGHVSGGEEKSAVETSGVAPTATFIIGATALVLIAAALYLIARGARRNG